jgi:hypothetical protein
MFSVSLDSADQQLIQAYSADLSAASVSDTEGPVNIMTIHRGPTIGPEID